MQMQDQLINSENVEDGSYDSSIFEFESFVVNAIFKLQPLFNNNH